MTTLPMVSERVQHGEKNNIQIPEHESRTIIDQRISELNKPAMSVSYFYLANNFGS